METAFQPAKISLIQGLERVRRAALNISIRSSLICIIAVLGVVLSIIVAWSWHSNALANQYLRTIYLDRVVPLRQLQIVSDSYSVVIADAVNKAVIGNWTSATAAATINQELKNRSDHWGLFVRHATTPEEIRYIDEINPLMTELDRKLEMLVDALAHDDHDAIQALEQKQLHQNVDLIVLLLGNLLDFEVFGADQSYREAASELQKSQSIADTLALVAIAMLIAAAGLVVWRVIRPIQKMTSVMSRLAHDDFTVIIPGHDQNDEIGQMARAVLVFKQNSMDKESLRVILEQENVESLEARAKAEAALQQLREAQTQLLQSEKLAALGGMVAGIAHEINTPLGSALTVGSTISDMTNELKQAIETNRLKRSDLDSFMDRLERASRILMVTLTKAGDLVRNFKQVAVDQTSDRRRVFELSEVIGQVMMTVSPIFKSTPHRIELPTIDPLQLDSYPGPLGQVLTNLLTNTMDHAFEESQAGIVTIAVAAQNQAVVITVSDNGKGIPADHLGRVFDPFFTTRLGKGGSGLGLNIVYGIVTRVLGGSVELSSEVGKGTIFTVTIPLTAPNEPVATPELTQEMSGTA